MSVELKVPSMGESVFEVELGDWLKNEGESVSQDEPLVVIESDKVTVELPAPVSGKVSRIIKGKGETAQIDEVIGYMEEGEVAEPAADETEKPQKAAESDKAPASKSEKAPASKSGKAPAAKPAADAKATPRKAGEAKVMPAARRALAERGLDAGDVTPSGPGGRLLKEDVQKHSGAAPAAAAQAGAREEEVVPMSRLRRRIAERLVEAQHSAALLTTFNEIDMSAVIALRKQYKDAFVERYGVKLGFMSFFVKATIEALKMQPVVNAEIRDDSVVYKNYFDIGIAVGGGRGLVVPVLRNAERMSFSELEETIADFARRAQSNELTLDELEGGTFTISNGGVYGSMMSTPIVNPPQTAILGLHAIKERPVAENGEVVIRPMMYVALTYDHRVIDGRESVTFLKRIKETIEEPSRILLEI